MSKITIYHINETEIFSHECEGNTIKVTVEEAVKQGVNLSEANLSHANLSGALIENETLTKNPITKSLNWFVLITEKYFICGLDVNGTPILNGVISQKKKFLKWLKVQVSSGKNTKEN